MRRALRSLTFFWKQSLTVALGAAVASTVLTGALLTGDSVRGSLRDLTLERLGGIDLALAAEHFFREDLAADLVGRRAAAAAAPMIVLRGTAVHGMSGVRAAGLAIYGVDARFAQLYGAGLPELAGGADPKSLFPPVVINESLRRELGTAPGEEILLHFERPGEIPRETLLGEKEADDVLASSRFTVARVLPDRGLGRFGLAAHQAQTLTAFVPLARLQEATERPGEVNALVAAPPAGAETVELRDALRLEDFGLRLVGSDRHLSLESEEFFLDPAAVTAAERIFEELTGGGSPSPGGGRVEDGRGVQGVRSTKVFTYLSTGLRVRGKLLPYSMVAGLAEVEGHALQDDEILLNRWAADDLQARLGDRVDMSYLVMGSGGGLIERTTTLRLGGVVEMTGLGADRTLTPRFPGLENTDDMADWDPPFPVDMNVVRPQDEQYWDTYGAAPKAFVSLAVAARRLWATRFGDLTAIRFQGNDLARVEETLRRELPRRVALEPFGMVFQPVKREGLAAADAGPTDFAGLFLAFSFFLILSAVLLVGLVFSLAVERRAGELGLLLAVGYPLRAVRRQLLLEGAVLAGLGSLLGLAGALGYAWLLMAGLRTWWAPAVGTSALSLHVTPAALATGWAASVLVVVLAVAWTVRKMSRLPSPLLLAGQTAVAGPGRRSRLARWLAPGAAVAAAVLLVVAGGAGASPALWFGVGASLLVSGLSLVSLWLRRPRPARHLTLAGMAARNGAASPGRSLLSVALVASACFVLVTVAANRRNVEDDVREGAGGFPLFAESSVPLAQAPGIPAGRIELGLSDVDEAELQGVSILSLHVVPGDDVSCLNLYRPTKPRLLGATQDLTRRSGFRFQKTLEPTEAPWSLLEKDLGPDVIPAIADAASATWILKLGLGDDLSIETESGRPVRLRLVGTLERSLFQSELLISEANLLRHFPSQARRSFFLIDAPPERLPAVTQTLEEGLGRYGFDVSSTAERLASYHAVEDTYLSTFQALGGFGLLLGTLGLGIALLRSLIERRGELATLRAFGFRRQRIARLVIAENGFLLLLGVAIGTISGLLAVAPNLGTGHLPWAPLSGTILAVVAVGLLSCTAAVWSVLKAPLLATLKEER